MSGPIQAEFEESSSERRGVDTLLWKRLFGYALRHPRVLRRFLLAGAVVALVDVALPLVTRDVIDTVDLALRRGRQLDLWDLAPQATWYAGLSLLLALCVWIFIQRGGELRTSIAYEIRGEAFRNLQTLSFSFYDSRPVGWLMARMTSDCERLSNILAWGALDTVWGVSLMALLAIAMLALSPPLALCVLVTMPVLGWVAVVFQRRILESARKVRKTNSRITARYNEGLGGVRTSKVFAREEKNLDEFGDLSQEMQASSVRNQLQSALFLPLVFTIASLGTGLVLSFGGFRVATGGLSIGTLVAFLSYARLFFEPINELARWFAEMQMAQASGERVLGLIDEVSAVRDSEEVRARVARAAEHRARGLAWDGYADSIGAIEFCDVAFSYGADQPNVLSDFNLSVKPGQTIALVGATGGGKSTIVNLLCRFYEPTAGAVRIDGVDLRERSLGWLQSNLGIVLQTPYLFAGSVAENIRYGQLDASDEEVREAAQIAGVDSFVHELEDGYDTHVGEAGERLSTGQKQLVSFARAILAEPRILVLDEATSSIDTETEGRIQRALEHVLEGRTSFVIAHRLSTIRSADRILVIDSGRIVEAGTHAELIELGGRYHALYTEQSLRESGRTNASWS